MNTEKFNIEEVVRRINSKLIPSLSIKRNNFAKKLGYSESTISKSLSKKTDKYRSYFSKEMREAICNTFNVREEWLVHGIEPIFNSDDAVEEERIPIKGNAKVINEDEDYVWLETKIIPEKAGMSLRSSFFSELIYNQLKNGKTRVRREHKGEYIEVEATGDSMNDGTLRSMIDKDWYLARIIKRELWCTSLYNQNWNVYYFLHNERGHIIQEVSNHIVETGEISLISWNKDKNLFPDFNINLRDCYIVAHVSKLICREFEN